MFISHYAKSLDLFCARGVNCVLLKLIYQLNQTSSQSNWKPRWRTWERDDLVLDSAISTGLPKPRSAEAPSQLIVAINTLFILGRACQDSCGSIQSKKRRRGRRRSERRRRRDWRRRKLQRLWVWRPAKKSPPPKTEPVGIFLDEEHFNRRMLCLTLMEEMLSIQKEVHHKKIVPLEYLSDDTHYPFSGSKIYF